MLEGDCLVNFIELHPSSSANRMLPNEVFVLLKAEGFYDFCLDSLLVTVAWGRSEAYTKLLINEVSKGFWLFKHDSVRLVDKDQRVIHRLKVISYMILNLVLTPG